MHRLSKGLETKDEIRVHSPHKPTVIKEPTTANPNQIGIIPLTPRSIRNLLTTITGGLLVAHSIVQVGIYGFGAEKHWLDSLNMDRELNLPTLFSSALLLMAALLMQRLGQSSDRLVTQDWRLLSKIFIFLALDEALQIHEILIIPGLRYQVHPALASTWVGPTPCSPSSSYGAFAASSAQSPEQRHHGCCDQGPSTSAVPSAWSCLLYTSPSPRDLSTSRMPSSA